MNASSEKNEFAFTSESASDERFDELLSKVKSVGAKILDDLESPLYYETARDELEIGKRRVISFELFDFEYQIIRDTKKKRILGAGNKRLSEDLQKPIIEMKLKRRNLDSDQWFFIDLDELL